MCRANEESGNLILLLFLKLSKKKQITLFSGMKRDRGSLVIQNPENS